MCPCLPAPRSSLDAIIDFFKTDEQIEISRLQAQASARADQFRRMAQLQLQALSKSRCAAQLAPHAVQEYACSCTCEACAAYRIQALLHLPVSGRHIYHSTAACAS